MSELNISVVIMRQNMLISGEIYTTGKNFTLPLAVTAETNLTSGLIFVSFIHMPHSIKVLLREFSYFLDIFSTISEFHV